MRPTCKFPGFLRRDRAGVIEVAFVADKGDDDLRLAKLLRFLQPFPRVDECLALGDIVDEQRPNGASVLARGHGEMNARRLSSRTYNAVIA